MKKTSKCQLRVEIEFEEIYKALKQRDMNDSVVNVVALCRHLETIARDAAMSALVDFVHNEVSFKNGEQH